MFRFGSTASGSGAGGSSGQPSSSQPTSFFTGSAPSAPLVRPTPLPTLSAPPPTPFGAFGSATTSTATVDPRLTVLGGGKQNVYMSIAASKKNIEESFEEARIADYLKAYTTTGRPPQPQPTEPPGESARLALGLAPLFVPYVEIAPPDDDNSQYTDGKNPQIFTPHRVDTTGSAGAEFLQSITANTNYATHSFEELRVNAYAAGNKTASVPPVPTSSQTFAPSPLSSTSTLSSISSPAVSTSRAYAAENGQEYQSISCAPHFQHHSFEELHVAYMLAGREVTSAEIFHALGIPLPPRT